MATLTVVGETFARTGATFRFRARCDEAAACPISRVCQNLELNETYRVVAVRPKHHDVCTVHEGGVRVVEVEKVDPVASFPMAKLKGTMAAWEPPVCDLRLCRNWETCFNPAMRRDGRYEIIGAVQRMDCPMGYELCRATVRPAT
jgi:uncharacterized protein (UPF0179 family)